MRVLQHLAVPSIATILLVSMLLSLGVASASPGDHSTRYGSTAGDPRVLEDGKACFDALEEAGSSEHGSTCDVLYAHIFDLLNWAAVNVQRPPDEYEDLARGFSGIVGHEQFFNLNQLVLNSSPGFVEYQDAGEKPRWHKERGITADVVFDADVPITGYWYLSADYDEVSAVSIDDVPPGSDQGPDAGILPCLSVRMVLQTGQYRDQGTDLAMGTTTKTIVSAKGQENGEAAAQIDCPGAGPSDIMTPEEVTEFEVVLEPVVDQVVIPANEGFIVIVEWYQFAPGDPDNQDKLYQGQTNVHTGIDYLARVLVPIQDAVRIDDVRTSEFEDKVYVQVETNSPWGSYDVDPGAITLTVRDANGEALQLEHMDAPLLRYSVDHDGHFKPVTATFGWDRHADAVPAGDYTIEARALNWQHTATAVDTTEFTIRPDRQIVIEPSDDGPAEAPRESPGLGVAGLLVALAGLVAVGRRRKPGVRA